MIGAFFDFIQQALALTFVFVIAPLLVLSVLWLAVCLVMTAVEAIRASR